MPRPAEGKQASLQREIASVMAACGLRNIRYVTFPPVVFATPAPIVMPEPQPEPVAEASPPEPIAMAELVAEPVADAAPVAAEALVVVAPPIPAAPEPVMAAPPAAAPEPAPILPAPILPAPALAPPARVAAQAAPRPGMRRLAEFAAEVAEARRPSRAPPPSHPAPPAELAPGQAPPHRYALLQDIAGELRPRRVRARSGKRA